MLSFKFNQVLSYSSSLRVRASTKRTLTKGGEYAYHTFDYNQLLSGGTVTTSLCTCVWFLWRTTLYYEFAGNFFPSRGALPPPDFGKLLGLEFGTSILHRKVNLNDLAFTFSTVSVHHDGAGGQSQTELESSINNSFPAFRGPSPIARTKHHLRIRILKIMMKEFPRNSEQQRRRVLCGTSTTFLSTNLSLTSAVFTLPTGLQ